MKDQYYGDVNDFYKYGLLRGLTGELRAAVCWMLTQSDGSTDGRFVEYLRQPLRWRDLDPDLFDHLRDKVLLHGERAVGLFEASGLLPEASYYSRITPDDAGERQAWFSGFLRSAEGAGLVFFDPDNGLQVKSVPYGKPRSSKYLYWPELEATFAAGHSLLVFQYFVRQKREPFVERLAAEMARRCDGATLWSFWTPRVVFLLAARPSHESVMGRAASGIEAQWDGTIVVHRHPR